MYYRVQWSICIITVVADKDRVPAYVRVYELIESLQDVIESNPLVLDNFIDFETLTGEHSETRTSEYSSQSDYRVGNTLLTSFTVKAESEAEAIEKSMDVIAPLHDFYVNQEGIIACEEFNPVCESAKINQYYKEG